MKLLQDIHHARQAAERRLGEHVKDVTLPQLFLLSAIAQLPKASQTTLVDATGIDRSTLADLVKRLCKRGLVRRVRDKNDSRAYNVDLTAAGKKALASGAKAAVAAETALVADWPALKGLVS